MCTVTYCNKICLKLSHSPIKFSLIFISLRDIKQSLTDCYLLLYQTFLTNFGALYLTEFLTDFGQILDSNSYDQAQQTL